MAMTSIYYTECGHWGRRNLSGSSRSRERYVESLGEGELYPDYKLSLIHISEPTRRTERSRMPSSA